MNSYEKVQKDIYEIRKMIGLNKKNFSSVDSYNHLFEQIYNKTHQIYYTISPVDFDKLNDKTLYLSKSKDFCFDFFNIKWPSYNKRFLYSIRPIKKLDLFNPSSESDRNIIREFIPDQLSQYFEKMILLSKANSPLEQKQNIRHWTVIERFENEIKAAGFDGFALYCSYHINQKTDFHDADNIAIFDSNDVIIVDKKEISI